MLKLKDLPPEEMSEVVRVASEMHDRETAEARERTATVAAAEEVGIPEEYLERAAQEVHARRVAAVLAKRRKRRITAAATVTNAALGLIGGGSYLLQKPPAPMTVSLASATPELTDGVDATLSREADEVTLTVRKFRKDARGTYNANISVAPPQGSLSGFRTANFMLDGGSGGLRQIRLDIQNGPTERWKGPLISIPSEKTPVSVSLREFTYQTRESSSTPWKSKSYRPIRDVTRFGFKTGDTINPIDATGSVTVADLRFE